MTREVITGPKAAQTKDWSPETYSRFRGLRLRPALDLLAQIGDLPVGDVVDLGCGDGAVAEALRLRAGAARLIGVDSSAPMLDAAQGYDQTVQADIAGWQPQHPPALIFSNAALHWLPDHAGLLPRLAALLAPKGWLAVQMPRQFDAPSHALARAVAARLFADRFDAAPLLAPVHAPATYAAILAPLGRFDIWETEYLQVLAPFAGGHPVRAFTESTALRPILGLLTKAEGAQFLHEYDKALLAPYPLSGDGSVLFPFRRLFFTLERP